MEYHTTSASPRKARPRRGVAAGIVELTANVYSKRIALYYRVSTHDLSTDPQRLELHDYCQRKGWSVTAEYTDTISGAKFTRTGLDRLMAAVRKRKMYYPLRET